MDILNKIKNMIPDAASNYLKDDPELNCAFGFQAGAESLIPIIEKLLEQRNEYINLWVGESYELIIQEQDEKLLNNT